MLTLTSVQILAFGAAGAIGLALWLWRTAVLRRYAARDFGKFHWSCSCRKVPVISDAPLMRRA